MAKLPAECSKCGGTPRRSPHSPYCQTCYEVMRPIRMLVDAACTRGGHIPITAARNATTFATGNNAGTISHQAEWSPVVVD
jgi:hypothetical protein